MNGGRIRLRRADETDLSYVEERLEANGLPSGDVRSSPGRFYVGYDGDERVCVAGVETYGADGLLRSVVVEEGERGGGYGTALCAAVEARAASDGVDTLYLLTTTAADFFADREYAVIDRSDAPRAIRRTAEFDELCPATATCMKKSL